RRTFSIYDLGNCFPDSGSRFPSIPPRWTSRGRRGASASSPGGVAPRPHASHLLEPELEPGRSSGRRRRTRSRGAPSLDPDRAPERKEISPPDDRTGEIFPKKTPDL